MEIGPKAIPLGRRRTFVVAKFDLGGGDMKMATIKIGSVKLHTPEPPFTDTSGYGGEKAADSNTTDNRETTLTDPVFVQVFETPAPDPLDDEAFRVVVAQTMYVTTGWPLSELAEAGGSVVGTVSSHVMDAYTVDMPPPPEIPRLLPFHQNIPVPLPPPSFLHIPAPCTPLPHCCSPGERPITRSHSKV